MLYNTIKKSLLVSFMSVVLFSCDALGETVSLTFQQQQSIAAIYGRWYSKPLLSLLTSNKLFSVLAGLFANSRLSAWFIAGFIRQYSLDESEFLVEVHSFKTFNEFFTRKLKSEARPILIDEQTLISPADGAVSVIPVLHDNLEFPVKCASFTLKTLLQDERLVEEFKDGTAYIIRLAPWDYHRLHFPVSGLPSHHRVIHGHYHSVHPYVYQCGFQPLEVNERHLIIYETDLVGRMAIIPVGALFVGAITYTYTPHMTCDKGDELGYFSFGGSTVVLLFQKDTITIPENIRMNSAEGKETPIRMGELLAEIQQ